MSVNAKYFENTCLDLDPIKRPPDLQSDALPTELWMYYRGLKFVPLWFKRLVILQSVNKMKLNLSSCFFSKSDSSKAKIFKKLVAFALF